MTYKLYNGTAPHVSGSDTSLAAAQQQTAIAGTKRQQVVAYITARGLYGSTCDECEHAMGMLHTTCSARIREAVLDRQVEDSGRRRKTRNGSAACVYISTANHKGLF